jgi:hypothetical protein
MPKPAAGEEFAVLNHDGSGFFSPTRGNINPALKSGDTVKPMGGDPTPPEFKKH